MSASDQPDSHSATQLFESLSALIDDEATEFELHRILAESEQNLELRSRWQRYQLASSALKQEYKLDNFVDLSHSVRKAVADLDCYDPALQMDSTTKPNAAHNGASFHSPKTPNSSNWAARAGRFAIAASVAGIVFVGAQQFNLLAVDDEVVPRNQLAGSSLDNQSTTAIVPFSSSAQTAPAMPMADNPLELSGQAVPVPMQTVSDADSFIYQERRLPQLRYPVQDPRLPEYRQMTLEYFNQLIIEHAEHAAYNSSSSLLPYARVPEEAENVR